MDVFILPEFPTNLIFKDAGQLETLTEHRPVSLYVPSLIRRCSPLLFSFCLHNRVRQVRQPGCTLCLPLSPSNRSTLGVLATVSLNTVLLDSDRLLTHCFPLLRPCGNQVRRGLRNTIQEKKERSGSHCTHGRTFTLLGSTPLNCLSLGL